MLNMKVDDPRAFRFIMQDEIYLLEKDKGLKAIPLNQNLPVIDGQPVDEQTPAGAEQQAAKQKEESQGSEPIVKTLETTFNYLGKNNKNFLVLVNYANEEHIAAPHLAALQNILKRKELSLDDVAILNINKYAPVKLTALAKAFEPAKLIIMGKDSLPEGIGQLTLNKPLQGKKTHVLYSFSFDEMMSSNDNKKAFWEQMKNL
jgi:DNA polymerase III psi subunit